MRIKLLLCLSLILMSLNFASSQIWIKTDSLPVGIVETIAINPINGKILVGIYGEGVFRSDINGSNWTNASMGLPDKLIKVIRYNSEGTAFAGLNGSGIFKSTDDGQNWVASNNGLTNKNVLDVYVSQDGNIYAGTWFYGSVFVSTDKGQQWTDLKLDNKDVHSVIKAKDGSILAGTEYNGLYKTNDNGKNWKSVGFSTNNIYDMAVDENGKLYLGAKDGFYVSNDNGENWTSQNNGIGATVIRAITISKAKSIFAGTSAGVYRSIDYGLNWKEYSDGLDIQNKNIFSLNSGIDDIIYAGTANGVYKTQIADSYDELNSNIFQLIISPIPFNNFVKFKLTIESSGTYTLIIYDIFGRKIDNLFDGYLSVGTHLFEWQPKNLSFGSYFFRIINNNQITQGKLLYIP